MVQYSLSEEFDRAVIDLYSVFSAYGLRGHIPSCPCCRDPRTTRPLELTPLRELSADDLQEYTYSAMTTVGGVGDFKYLLPRILELLPGGFPLEPKLILGKLRYANWLTWPQSEQQALHRYLNAIWTWARRTWYGEGWRKENAAGEWLCAIAQADLDLDPYLQAWQQDTSPEAAESLEWFLSTHAVELAGLRRPGPYWKGSPELWTCVQNWARKTLKPAKGGL